jgi:lambda family phage portal protein
MRKAVIGKPRKPQQSRSPNGRFKNAATTFLTNPAGLSNQFGYGNYGASRRKVGLEEWRAFSASADQDIIYNLPLLRVRSRDLFMGSPIAGGAVLTLRINVVGNGLTPMPQVDGPVLGMDAAKAADTNKFLGEEFDIFADTVECDWNRRSTFYQLQDLTFVNEIISGDILALLPMKKRKGSIYDTKIRLIEADRVANPFTAGTGFFGVPAIPGNATKDGLVKTFGGVELTDDGEVDAYWVSKYHPLSLPSIGMAVSGADPQSFTRVPAFGEETGRPVALLIAEMERPEQRRGVPLMSKCMTEMKNLQRYVESTTVQNVIKSYFTAFITSAMPSTEMFSGIVDSSMVNDLANDLVARDPYLVKLGPGIINWMRPGDAISFPANAGPEGQFEPYVIALCKFIGSCLGIPFEVLLKQFNSSYSASRAALLEFWRRVKVLRQLLVDQFCQPIYLAWMMEAVAKGIITAPGFFDDPRIQRAWTKCSWSGSSPGSIDPLKEVMASDKKVKLGVSTLERESLEINGSDWRANTMQQGIEADLCEEVGLPYARLQDTKAAPIPATAGDTTGTGETPPEGDLGDAGDTGDQGDSGTTSQQQQGD